MYSSIQEGSVAGVCEVDWREVDYSRTPRCSYLFKSASHEVWKRCPDRLSATRSDQGLIAYDRGLILFGTGGEWGRLYREMG